MGALLVRDRTILSTGYNGSIRGLPHCDDVGHMMENGHCVATVHAEANAILQAAKNGVRHRRAPTIYTTASPCWPCFKLIANTGCTRIVFGEFYRDPRIFEYAAKLDIELVGLGPARAATAEPLTQLPADTQSPSRLRSGPASSRQNVRRGPLRLDDHRRNSTDPARITGPGLTIPEGLPKSSHR